MKKIMLILVTLLSSPLFASVNCLDKSQHLQESFDDKEWHSVACNCSCDNVQGGYCVQCRHLQNASTYTIVIPTKVAQQTKMRLHIPENPQDVIRKLALEYLQSKKE